MTRKKLNQLILLLLLVTLFVIIHYNNKNHLSALLWYTGILLVFWLFRIISNGLIKVKNNRVIHDGQKISAKIISTKVYKNLWVLQLSVKGHEGPYVTSYVHCNPNNSQRNNYQVGQNIPVFIHPKDKNNILDIQTKQQKVKRTGSNWGAIIWTAIIFLSVGLPLLFHLFDPANKVFKDINYVIADNNLAYIWELRHESPKNIYIKIIDPVNKKTIKVIKEKKENDLDYYLNFKICRQSKNIVIIGLGSTPLFDVYDPITYEKISGISEFEQSNKKLQSGIVKIEKETYSSKFMDDFIIELLTTDGITCFYNVEKDLFFYSEKELRKYIDKTDKDILAQSYMVFALSQSSGSDYQSQAYLITSDNKNILDEFYRLAGSTSFNPERFEKDKRYKCKKCNARLLTDEIFLEAQIAYYDTSMVVINSLVSMKKDDFTKITAFDKTGKLLFSIHGSEYPNIQLMAENGFRSSNSSDFKFIRIKDELAIFIREYGAIGIDLNTGKQLWKYTP